MILKRLQNLSDKKVTRSKRKALNLHMIAKFNLKNNKFIRMHSINSTITMEIDIKMQPKSKS